MPKYKITWKQTEEHSNIIQANSEQDARVIFEDMFDWINEEENIFIHSIEIKEN